MRNKNNVIMAKTTDREKLVQQFEQIKQLTQAAHQVRQKLKKHKGERKIYHDEITLGSGDYPCAEGQALVVAETGHKRSATELRVITPEEFSGLVKNTENRLIVKKLAWRARRLFKFFAPPRERVLAEIKESAIYAQAKFPERLFIVKKEMLTEHYGVFVDPWSLQLRPLEKLNLLKRFVELNDQIRDLSGSKFSSAFNAHVIARGEYAMKTININVTDTHVHDMGVKDPCYCLRYYSFYMLDYAQLDEEIKRLDKYFGLTAEQNPPENFPGADKGQDCER